MSSTTQSCRSSPAINPTHSTSSVSGPVRRRHNQSLTNLESRFADVPFAAEEKHGYIYFEGNEERKDKVIQFLI